MKLLKTLLFIMIILGLGKQGQSQTVEHLLCDDYWVTVDFSYHSLSASHFTFRGEADRCHADSNSSYPFDEKIYIFIYNHYDSSGAQEEFQDEKAASTTIDGYMEVYNLGDEAFAILRTEFGKLDSIIIEVVKGQYTIQFDINGNSANNSNNRFTKDTVLDFARTVVEGL